MEVLSRLQWSIPSPEQSVPLARSGSVFKDVHLRIKRDDLIHPVVSGNKARKLLQLAKQWLNNKPSCVISMGGNRSNFIHSLGYLCHQLGIPLVAKIRGQQPQEFGPTLNDLLRWQVKLDFVDKLTYRKYREEPDFAARQAIQAGAYWLPEGGSDVTALQGLISATDELTAEPQAVFVPVGTGITALGLALGFAQRGWNTRVIGVVVVRGAEYLTQSLMKLCEQAGVCWPERLYLDHRFCGRGFGKINDDLLKDQQRFEQALGVRLDPIYLTKCCRALEFYCSEHPEKVTGQVLLWHTGGLQGNRR